MSASRPIRLRALHILVYKGASTLCQRIALSTARATRAERRQVISSAVDAPHCGLGAGLASMPQSAATKASDKRVESTAEATATTVTASAASTSALAFALAATAGCGRKGLHHLSDRRANR